MAGAFVSDNWYRVAALQPSLARHARVVRQRFRGKSWYVLYDRASGNSWRFAPVTWSFVNSLDGHKTVDAAWQAAVAELGDEAPSQDEVISVLSRLHAADMLTLAVPADIDDLARRREHQLRARFWGRLVNPLSVRIPLWDPDPFLERSMPWIAPLARWPGAVLWLVTILPAAFLAYQHGAELTHNLSDHLLALDNLALLLVVFPLVKFAHEMGHAYITKAGGGEVHEMGILLLVFAPVPYVDASASTAFRSKWRRALVGAAGMLVELWLAALAMYLWLALEPGFMRSIAFNVIIVAGITTVLFNVNPLLRYDGYYILGDLLEIANLGQRANQYYGWLFRRHVMRETELPLPHGTGGERAFFLIYAPAALVYRVAISIGIALFIANKYFVFGVLIALWSVVGLFIVPTVKTVGFLLRTRSAPARGTPTAWVPLTLTVAVLAAILFVPLPLSTQAEAVVWVPDQGEVRAAGSGFFKTLRTPARTHVESGMALFELEDPALRANYLAQVARVDQLLVQSTAEFVTDRTQAAITRDALQRERKALDDIESRLAELVTMAATDGQFVLAKPEDLPGHYIKRGDLIGYVIGPSLRTVRVVVNQDDVGLVRAGPRAIELKLVDRAPESFSARLVREVPGGSERLPSKALSTEGGGPHAPDPRDPEGLKTLTKVFQFDLEIIETMPDLRLGTRAVVRFTHAPEALIWQLWRRVRQMFLASLHV